MGTEGHDSPRNGKKGVNVRVGSGIDCDSRLVPRGREARIERWHASEVGYREVSSLLYIKRSFSAIIDGDSCL